jgi:hypothetical protein
VAPSLISWSGRDSNRPKLTLQSAGIARWVLDSARHVWSVSSRLLLYRLYCVELRGHCGSVERPRS